VRAALARRGRLVVEDLPEPEPGPGDLVAAVRACGICGSDLHTLTHASAFGELAGAMAGTAGGAPAFDPEGDFVMGHEFCVEVLELGPGTEGAGVRPGDLAVSIPVVLTPTGLAPIGFSNTYGGAYAERMRLSAALCLKVPDGMDPRLAALTEPTAVGVHALARGEPAPGDGALVVGCGPIGLAVIAAARAAGVEPVVAADFSPARRALAVRLGAHEVVDPAAEPAIEAWRRLGGARRLVVFEAVGVPGVIDRIMRDVPPQTRVVVVGVCMEEDRILPLLGVVKELDLRFAFGYQPHEFAGTLRRIAEGELDVGPMVTGRVGLDGLADAFAALGRPDEQVKVLVEPDGPSALSPLRLG
jgi:threonine dehydrogenase-like Zn-dependent dehydrogenase